MKFVSLHGHTSFSTGDGHGSPQEHVDRVKELGMKAMAITEHGSVSSHVQIEQAAKKAGIKPIFGLEAYVANPGSKPKFHQTILAMNQQGYVNLNRLVTNSYIKKDNGEGFYMKPTVNLDSLFDKKKTEGLIILSGCASSMLACTIAGGKGLGEELTKEEIEKGAHWSNFAQAMELVDMYQETFGDRFYLEVQRFHDYHKTVAVNQVLERIWEKTQIPMVATADVHYPRFEDWDANQLANAIGWNTTVEALENGARKYDSKPGQTYPTSDKEMAKDLIKAGVSKRNAVQSVLNTKEVAKRCNVELPKTDPVRFSESDGTDEQAQKLLKQAIKDGIRYRCETDPRFKKRFKTCRKDYAQRIKKELKTILPKGFSDYFLINKQIIGWAKDNGIVVGPGRGCLTNDSKVLTQRGFVSIDKVEVGDSVWTHEGRWKPVENTFSYDVDEDLIKISSFYDDQGVTLTKDHKVLVKKCERETNKSRLAQGYRFINPPQGENVWVEAKDVEKDDLVMLPIPESSGLSTDIIDLANFAESRDEVKDEWIVETRIDTGEETWIPRFVNVDSFSWVLGAFVSNGWTRTDRNRREVGFATQASKDDEEVQRRFFEAFGVNLALQKKGKKDLHQYVFLSRTLRNLFESSVPGYQWKAETKTLPQWVHDMTINQKRSLVEGLWWGDGSNNKGQKVTYSTASKSLSEHVRLLLWAIGAPAGVSYAERFDNREEFYGVHGEYKITTTRGFKAPRGQNGFRDEKYIYLRVNKIDEVKDVNKVYDIQVADDHSFMTDSFVVHNSAAGSVICYLLRLTEVDPIEFPEMVFERFLDPGREDDPDIDTDYQDDRRNEVFDFARSVYGEANVGNIGNFSRYRGKSAVKAAAKALKIPASAANDFSEYISEAPFGDPREFMTAYDAEEAFPEAKEIADKYPSLRRAYKLEGDMRTLGIHAAGMVLSNRPISDTCAIYSKEKTNGDKAEVIAYDKRDAAYLKMLKLDCLGLSTMTIVSDVLEMLDGKLTLEELYALPRNDEKVLKGFAEDKLTGIFQFEGRATRTIVKQIFSNTDKIPTFMQLADMNALSRPGSLSSGMTAQYVRVERGEEPKSIHPLVDEILADSNGCLVYQEQVMKIGQAVGGLDDHEIGRLRKIIGAKQAGGAFDEFWKKFRDGAAEKHGMEEAMAREIWDYMAASASYLFNVAHAICYALVAYWTMYLKVYYPAEFYAACLRNAAKKGKTKGKADPQLIILQEAVKEGLSIYPPRPTLSRVSWWPNTKRTGVQAGFMQIPKVGPKVAERMNNIREENFSKVDPWVTWDFYVDKKIGFGAKAAENARELEAKSDPFDIGLTSDAVATVLEAINNGETGLDMPDATAETIPSQSGETVTYVGHVITVKRIDVIGEMRKRDNLTTEEVLEKLKHPEKATKAKIICTDQTGGEVHVNISRFDYPKLKSEIDEIDEDKTFVIHTIGNASSDFGPAIQGSTLTAIELES